MNAPTMTETPLAWGFRERLRAALLARLFERMLSTRWEITALGGLRAEPCRDDAGTAPFR